jgi:hypothetical protein
VPAAAGGRDAGGRPNQSDVRLINLLSTSVNVALACCACRLPACLLKPSRWPCTLPAR